MSLREFPERGRRATQANCREFTVRFGRDGYVVQYLVQPDVVIVLRIFHGLEDR